MSLENVETDPVENMEEEVVSDSEEEVGDEDNSYQYDTASLDRGDDEDAIVQEPPKEDDDQDIFLMAYCDFLNRLSNFHFIPQSTIKIIAEEYIRNYMKANESKDIIFSRWRLLFGSNLIRLIYFENRRKQPWRSMFWIPAQAW